MTVFANANRNKAPNENKLNMYMLNINIIGKKNINIIGKKLNSNMSFKWKKIQNTSKFE